VSKFCVALPFFTCISFFYDIYSFVSCVMYLETMCLLWINIFYPPGLYPYDSYAIKNCVSILKSLLTVCLLWIKKNIAVHLKQINCFSGQNTMQAATVWVTPCETEIRVNIQNHHDGQSEQKCLLSLWNFVMWVISCVSAVSKYNVPFSFILVCLMFS
jgi:hypothetical protein